MNSADAEAKQAINEFCQKHKISCETNTGSIFSGVLHCKRLPQHDSAFDIATAFAAGLALGAAARYCIASFKKG